MPLAYTIESARQLITITGEYSEADEWRRLLQALLEDPARRPGFAILRDLRTATTPISASGVMQLMEVVRYYWPLLQTSRAAILTPREFDPAAMVAHALADTHQLPMRIFNSFDVAIEWLQGTGDAAPRAGDPTAS